MKYTRIIFWSSIILGIMVIPALCATNTPAKNELKKRNIPFTQDAFIQSVLQGDTAVVKLFLSAGMNPNLRNSQTGYTALMLAAGSGNASLVKMFIQKGAAVNTQSPIGFTPLLFATRSGNIETIKTLLNAGAKVNAADTVFGYTPLMVATMLGNSEVAKLLIDTGANPTLKSKDGDTVVILAAANEFADLARMLVTAGAPKYGSDKNKNLITAIVLNEPVQVKKFLSAGANVDAKDENGTTTLIIAAHFGYQDIVKLLLDAGAQENVKLALYYAAMKGYIGVVNLIKQARQLDTISPILENDKLIGLAYDEDTDGFSDKREYFDEKGLARTEWFNKGKNTPYTISWTVYDKNGIKRGQKISLTGTGVVNAVNEKPPQNRMELAKDVLDPDWNRIVNYTPAFEKNVLQQYPALIKQIYTRENNPEKECVDARIIFIYYFEDGRKRNLEYYSRPGGPPLMFEMEDKNKDGNAEWIIISEWSSWKMSVFDENDDGKPEKWEYPGLIEFDMNGDGVVDRWVVIDERTQKVYLDTTDKTVFETYQKDTSRNK